MIWRCFVREIHYDPGKGIIMVSGEIEDKPVMLEFYRMSDFTFPPGSDKHEEMRKTAYLLSRKIKGQTISIDFQGDSK